MQRLGLEAFGAVTRYRMPTVTSTVAVAVLLSACQAAPTAPTEMELTPLFAASGKGGGPPKEQPVSLRMTVLGSGPSGSYHIRGDGQGAYVDGQQGMLVQIDVSGNLQISPANAQSSSPPERTLTFDFSAPVDPTNTYSPDESGQWNWKIKTGNYQNYRIQDLGVNGNPVSACFSSTIAHNNQVLHHRAIFNPASDPSSTLVYVTRTSVSPPAWTVISDGPCIGSANVAGVWSQDLVAKRAPLVFRGYFDQGLSLLLEGL